MNTKIFSALKPGKIALVFGLIATVTLALVLSSGSHDLNAAETEFSDDQKAQIETIIESYMMENPEIVIKALEAHQKNQEAAEKQAQVKALSSNKDALFNNAALPVAGNPNGDVTVVEFFDYNCGYCKKALSDMMTLMKEDNNLKVVFIDIPILSQASHTAARWALAANEQGKYLDYHVALMSNRGSMTEDDYIELGEELGLDVAKLERDATENEDITAQINENLKLSRSLNIRGTPAFVIGDQIAPGYVGIDAMRDAVEEARKDAGQ